LGWFCFCLLEFGESGRKRKTHKLIAKKKKTRTSFSLPLPLPQRGNHFAATSTRARATIADLGARFVRPGSTLLTHGHSRVVLALLRRAASKGQQFSVVVTEGRPDEAGLKMAKALAESGIPVTVIIDSAVAWSLEALSVDFALVGAEAVVESGGAVSKLGTYGVAVAAKVKKKERKKFFLFRKREKK